MSGNRIQELSEKLSISKEEFAYLLNMAPSSFREAFAGRDVVSSCTDKILRFLEESLSEAVDILSQRPTPAFQDEMSMQGIISSLQEAIGATKAELARILSVDEDRIYDWIEANKTGPCNETLLWLLSVYSGVDRDQWPSIFRIATENVGNTISPERVLALRKSFLMRQVDLGNLLHVVGSAVSQWEVGRVEPGWCANLLLLMLEEFPGPAFDLLERVPYGEWEGLPEKWRFSEDKARGIRLKLGLTQVELGHLLGITPEHVQRTEAGYETTDSCTALVYELLDRYPEEFIELIRT